jgi:hypothetical protein
MTRWADQETVNDQSQEVDLRWRYTEVQMELVHANRVGASKDHEAFRYQGWSKYADATWSPASRHAGCFE